MNGFKMKVFFVLFALWTLPVRSAITEDSAVFDRGYQMLFQANQAYRQGAYEKAASIYEQLLKSQSVSGSVYYNLGNCYIRMNRLGKAILNYERAKLFIPRNPDLDFNLRYARDRIKDRTDVPKSVSTFQWLNAFNRSEVFWSFVIIHFLFWFTIILRLWIKSEWSFYLLIGTGILWTILGVSGGIKWYQGINDMRGVVVAPEINVRAGPDEKDTTLFKLHAGTIVNCEREEEGWRLIHITPSKRGWTKAALVERIVTPYSLL